MQENMKEYLTEKEAREKRLEIYTEKIQEKVLSRSSETIRQLVEERRRQKMTQQEIADITGIKPSNMPGSRAEAGYQHWLYWRNMRMHLENILK